MPECSCSLSKIKDFRSAVLVSERLSERIVWLTLKCPELAEEVCPGQCVMLFPAEGMDPLLGRPFAVAYTDAEKGEISICYMLLGRGTEMLSTLSAGREVRVRGPFGVPLKSISDKVYIAAGGVGIATFISFIRSNPEKIADVFLGIPGKGYEKYAAAISELVPDVRIFTDDGSFGEGDSMFKTLPEKIDENAEIWSCGPPGFLKAMEDHFAEQKEKLYFSLDNRMACGYGGCMGCVVETTNGLKRICVDQSIFRADEVISHEN
ncbi:MAG: hypothetical protein PHO18_02925 [Synergistaceae bacterium]|nr:hypothetical protein [Synergistaceae bacterium]